MESAMLWSGKWMDGVLSIYVLVPRRDRVVAIFISQDLQLNFECSITRKAPIKEVVEGTLDIARQQYDAACLKLYELDKVTGHEFSYH